MNHRLYNIHGVRVAVKCDWPEHLRRLDRDFGTFVDHDDTRAAHLRYEVSAVHAAGAW